MSVSWKYFVGAVQKRASSNVVRLSSKEAFLSVRIIPPTLCTKIAEGLKRATLCGLNIWKSSGVSISVTRSPMKRSDEQYSLYLEDGKSENDFSRKAV